MSTTSRRWRTTLAVAAASLALPLIALPSAAFGNPTAGDSDSTPVERKVRDQIAKKGATSFWVTLDSEADLSGAKRLADKADKAKHVRTAKTRHAKDTQTALRKLLEAAGAEYTSYWIDNSMRVTGDAELLADITARPEVERIEADDAIKLPEPIAGTDEATVDGIEWNIDRINAPRVWSELGVRGEGIVVANIDTGADHTHPALASTYRGRAADGTLNHNYNWFDPAGICPSAAPCDNNDHGSHTMGTMVGDDGTGNQIGVAPGAKWIAAKGCESSSCTRDSLLASGQWIVAPTDLTGANPRPDLAPDVVNNSWGSSVYDTWYAETVQSWIAAGIFPAFSNGNSGPSCNTSGTPGEYQISYSSGAFDINNAIANFSSRGPGENGDIKPNLAAPGVNVRSSLAGGGYGSFSGTSMASPHTAAVVALMWSASPAIQGDIAATRELLDNTAIDVDNTSCGGTADDNHVFGEGRLDAFAAVSATPRGALGALGGTVTSGGTALAGATVSVTGPMERTTTTADDGTYGFSRLMVGDYTVTVRKFGYLTGTATITVTEGQTATRDVTVEAAPSATLSGTVRLSTGNIAAGATVTVKGTPVATQTGPDGRYQVTLPHGDYELQVSHANRCAGSATENVSVTGDTSKDVTLPLREDGFGYTCGTATTGWIAGTDRVDLTGDDRVAHISLPFHVALYGKGYKDATISTNGWMAFVRTTLTVNSNRALPYSGSPNAALYPMWDDLDVDESSGVYTAVAGAKPNRTFVVEWRNVTFYSDPDQRLSFQVQIGENGVITYQYADVDSNRDQGESATIGMENANGSVGFQYSYNELAAADGGITFRSDTGVTHGVVTDANDSEPVAGATVTVKAGGEVVDSATTGDDGDYLLQLPSGGYQLEVAKEHYEAAADSATVTGGEVGSVDTALRTARVEASAPELAIVAPAGETRSRTVTLSNTGGLGTDYSVVEATGSGEADIPWLSVESTTGTLAPGAQSQVRITVDATGMDASSYQGAQVLIRSASGRQPTVTVPVTIVAPGYRASLDAGATGDVVDSYGDTWNSDQEYQAGSCGYVGRSHTLSSNAEITGTSDDSRYQSLRRDMYEYRFDGLADGTYTVELDFAELEPVAPDKHLFDVHVEDTEVLRNFDVAYHGGSYAAVSRTFTVTVTDGQLNVRFFTHKGYGKPIINAIRVTDRPDLAA